MDAPNPKRPRHRHVSSSIQNPNSLPSAAPARFNHQSQLDSLISSLLSFPDSSSPSLLALSIARALDKAFASASSDALAQNSLVDRTLQLTSLLHESTKRCFRERASLHNSNSWLLPPELTIKVFSKLDTKSLMRAMACCNMFKKCAMDPVSYSHINLTTSAINVDNGVVHTIIHRAQKELRFLEVGHVDHRSAKSKTPLLASCLSPLSHNRGFIGNRLRSLHLYNLKFTKDDSFIAALSACSNITDLKIVGVDRPSEKLLHTLAINCHMIEHLFFECLDHRQETTKKQSSALVKLVANIPNLTSLTLIGIRVNDATVQILAESARKLKHMNLSKNLSIMGPFLRLKDSALETLILRGCSSLEEKEVLQFLDSLLADKFRFIRHIDISNKQDDGGKRKISNFPRKKLKEAKPNVKFVVPLEKLKEARPKIGKAFSIEAPFLPAEEDLN